MSRRRRTYCDECQRWLLCHKYDAPQRLEEFLYLCDPCAATCGESQETAPSEAVNHAH